MAVSEDITLSTFNVLADCYAVGMDRDYKSLLWPIRRNRLKDIFKAIDSDIYCLQEVDHYFDFWEPFLGALGYDICYLQRPGRDDGCCIAFKRDKFICGRKTDIQFNDIADKIQSPIYRESFIRDNVGQVIVLQRSTNVSIEIAIANSHLYWNPNRPDIKLGQAKYLMEKLNAFLNDNLHIPVIICGDFNSLPESDVYNYFTSHHTFASPIISTGITNGENRKFICDIHLNKLCRWLRILGIDATLESEDMLGPKESGKLEFKQFFDTARAENRVILTTKKKMQMMASCPESFYVEQPLEQSLVQIFQIYGLKLDPSKFCTLCGKCGKNVEPCSINDERLGNKLSFIPDDKELFICTGCNQVLNNTF
jgi:uncharacterized protein with PIN domain